MQDNHASSACPTNQHAGNDPQIECVRGHMGADKYKADLEHLNTVADWDFHPFPCEDTLTISKVQVQVVMHCTHMP